MTKEIARSASSAGVSLRDAPPSRLAAFSASRRSWCGRLPPREENQNDGAHRDNQSDSSLQSERDSWGARSRGCKPTTLEELLDLELDVHVSSTEARGIKAGGNQLAADDFRFADPSDLSLELLALQSPHGQSEHWQENEDDRAFLSRDLLFEPKQVPSSIDVADLRKASSTSSSDGIADLASPGEHIPAFPPSPSHQASGDEYDMISPVALPESPAYAAQTFSHEADRAELWNMIPQLELDDDVGALLDSDKTSTMVPNESSTRAKSVTMSRPRRPRHRSSASPPRANNAYARSPPRSVHSERKPKAKHGGIYSLLLKFKPPEQEPMLVGDLRSPDLAWTAPASTKPSQSPPPSVGKPKHGSIYRMLRRAASQR